MHRRIKPEDFLDCLGDQGAVVAEQFVLLRMSDQLTDRVAKQVGRRLEPRRIDQQRVDDDFRLGQLVLPIAGLNHAAQEVVLRGGTPLRDQVGYVCRDLFTSRVRRRDLFFARGRLDTDPEGSNHRTQVLPISFGYANQGADHVCGQRERHLVDKVALTPEIVEEFVTHVGDFRPQLLDSSRREGASDEPSHPSVVGRIEEQHGHRALAPPARASIDPAPFFFHPSTAPTARVPQQRLGVVVAGEDPRAGHGVLKDRRVLADLPVLGVRVRDHLGVGEDLEQGGVRVERHGATMADR